MRETTSKSQKQCGLKRAATLLFLAPFLTACSNTVIQHEKIKPPQSLLIECEYKGFNGKTYGDLIYYTRELQSKYKVCAKQVREIRQWAK